MPDDKNPKLYPWQEKLMAELRNDIYAGRHPPSGANPALFYVLYRALEMQRKQYMELTPERRKLIDVVMDFRHRPLSHKLMDEVKNLGDSLPEFQAIMAGYAQEDDAVVIEWFDQGGTWLVVAPNRGIFENRAHRVGYEHADLSPSKKSKFIHVEHGKMYGHLSQQEVKVLVLADCWMGEFTASTRFLRDRFELVYEYRT